MNPNLGASILLGVSWFIAGALPAAPSPDEMARTLVYEPADVILVGRLTSHVFPGRPNYESIKDGDEPEEHYILKFDHPVSVRASTIDPDLHTAENNVHSTQVWGDLHGDDEDADAALERAMESLIGQEVVIKAALSHGINAHHHTDVMAGVKQIKRKGARHFIVPVKLTAEKKRRAEAKQADTEEKKLKEAGIVLSTGPFPTGMFRHGKRVRLEGVLAKAEVPLKFWDAQSSHEGTRTQWFLQFAQPIAVVVKLGTINDVSQDQLIENVSRLRLLPSLWDPLVRRNIRSAGIEPGEETSPPGEERDPRYAPLMSRRVRLTGTLDTAIRSGLKPERYDAEWLEYEVERIEWLPATAPK